MRISSTKATALLLASALAAPGVGMLCGLEPLPPLNENRALAPWPTPGRSLAGWRGLPAAFARYFDDHFGFRPTLVRLNFLVRTRLLGASTSSFVVVGRGGWLYYTGDGEMEAHRGHARLDPDGLRNMGAAFYAKSEWLARRSIRYLLVIAPNKSTTYPEYVPAALTRAGGPTPADELVDHLRRNTPVAVLDLRPALAEARRSGQVFFRLDTHWNDLGAFAGYRALQAVLEPWWPAARPLGLAEVELQQRERRGGDLASMVGGGDLLGESDVRVVPRTPPRARVVERSEVPRSPWTTAREGPGLPRALVFADSFAEALSPYMAEHFARVRWLVATWDAHTDARALVDEHRPDVVIEEMVERLIAGRAGVAAVQGPPVGSALLRDLAETAGCGGETLPGLELLDGSEVTRTPGLVVRRGPAGVEVRSTGDDPQVVFPTLLPPRDGLLVAEATVTSPDHTVLQLFYQEEGDAGFSEAHSVIRELAPGINRLALHVTPLRPIARIRLDPRNSAGEVVFHSLRLVRFPWKGAADPVAGSRPATCTQVARQ